jgi:hypothetical protein
MLTRNILIKGVGTVRADDMRWSFALAAEVTSLTFECPEGEPILSTTPVDSQGPRW